MKNILIINAHQKWEGMSVGNLNNFFQDNITSYFEDRDFLVKKTKIEDGYKINKQVQKHVCED